MGSAFNNENLDREFTIRTTQRRSGYERRTVTEMDASELVNDNKKLLREINKLELSQSFDNTEFTNKFGWF